MQKFYVRKFTKLLLNKCGTREPKKNLLVLNFDGLQIVFDMLILTLGLSDQTFV